jgi:hypothetical protein
LQSWLDHKSILIDKFKNSILSFSEVAPVKHYKIVYTNFIEQDKKEDLSTRLKT